MADFVTALDSDWLRANPLPEVAIDANKNDRGRVLVIGGSRFVPGGISLTAEAALRAGAGKVQVATIESAAIALGIAMPEIGVIGLAETTEGDIIPDHAVLQPMIEASDVVVAGPAMSNAAAAEQMVASVMATISSSNIKPAIVLDAAALLALPSHVESVRRCASSVILTPHCGELAAMLGCQNEQIASDPVKALRRAVKLFDATTLVKGATSYIAAPTGEVFAYAGGGAGLATGGSGDVLAGIAAGLAARGASARNALAWAVWLHGEAGRRCAEKQGPIGFLARELLAEIPSLMRAL